MLLKDKEGNEIEIADDQVQTVVKTQSWYNDELNRIREKGEGSTREKLTADFDAQKKELEDSHAKVLADAKTMSTGKKDEQITLLMDANKQTEQSINDLKTQLAQKEESSKKLSLESELSKSLNNVSDDFVRNSLIDSGMKNSVIGEDGKAHFKLKNGVMGTANEMAVEFQADYPQHFKSEQPSGTGIKGGDVKANAGMDDQQRRIAKINAKFNK